MSFFIALSATALVVAVVAFVIANHWNEFYGDNHF
jgi:hypothetical protein